mgnify:CR=1 FL=1
MLSLFPVLLLINKAQKEKKVAQQILVLHPIKGDQEKPKTLSLPLDCVNEDSQFGYKQPECDVRSLELCDRAGTDFNNCVHGDKQSSLKKKLKDEKKTDYEIKTHTEQQT